MTNAGSHKGFDLIKAVEALKAVKEVDVNIDGLKELDRAVTGRDSASVLTDFLARSPSCSEIHAIWDAQLTAKHDGIIAALLALTADMLAASPATPLPQQQQEALQRLASSITARRMKALYFYLGSDVKAKANGALRLLAAIAQHSMQSARELVHALDFNLPALARLCHIPREKKGAHPGEAQRRQHRAWSSSDPDKRPSAALFLDFALALLRAADAPLLCSLLPVRPLWAGVLHNLAQLPPKAVRDVLEVLRAKLLRASAAIPPSLQAQPFGDTALAQIATVAAWEGSSAEGGGASGDCAAIAACSDAAQQLLLALCTRPEHGLATGEESGADDAGGRRRVQRLLQGLKPATRRAHYDLLLAVTGGQPRLAAAYLAGAAAALEPKASLRWWAGVTLTGRLVSQASTLPLPFLRLAERGGKPPAMDSGEVSGLLRRVFPPALPKAAMSRGVQHASLLVRYATLCALRQMLDALSAALSAAARAADSAGGSADVGDTSADTPDVPGGRVQRELAQGRGEEGGGGGNARAWQAFLGRLRSAARARLPDLQALLALHASLDGQIRRPPPPGAAADVQEGLEPVEAEGLSAPELAMVQLLAVLARWHACMPEAFAEARYDVQRLLPQDVLRLPPVLQHSILAVLEVAHAQNGAGPAKSGAAAPSSSGQGSSPSGLLPLLGLLRGAASPPGVAAAAGRLLLRRLRGAVGLEGSPGEARLWLDLLPATFGGPDSVGCADAVANFLAEAVGGAARRPHELWEAQQVALSSAPGGSTPPHSGEIGFSLLGVAALRQALKVARSAKMPAHARAAVCGYVAGVLASLLQLQADPAPLAAVIRGLLMEPSAAPRTSGRATPDLAHAAGETGLPVSVTVPAGEKRKRAGAPEAADAAAGDPNGMLPAEAQPLASLLAFAQSLSGSSASGSPQHEQEPRTPPAPKRKRAAALSSPAAGERTATVSLTVAGSQEATHALREALAAHGGARGADVDWLSMQTALLRAERTAVQEMLPEVARLAASAPAGEQAAGVLMWVCQAHAIQPQLSKKAYSNAGAARKGTSLQPLWVAAPFLLLLRAAMAEPGILEDEVIMQRLLASVRSMPPQKRALPILALLPAISSASTEASVLALFKLLGAALLDREGDGEQVVEAAVVAVALRHPGLLCSFLRAEQRPGSQRALRRAHAKDVGTAQLLRRLLSSTASGQQPRLAAGLDGAARPYLQRVVEVLRAGLSPEQQAQSGPQHLQAAAEAACTTLAEHLPLQDCAALAERILAVPAAAPSTLDLGLRLAGRFLGAPSIADRLELPRIMKALARFMLTFRGGAEQRAAAEAYLAQALRGGEAGATSLAAWHLAEEAERVLAFCVAEPSERAQQRSRIAAALVAALPPCHALFARLLPARLALQDGDQALALLLPAVLAHLQHGRAEERQLMARACRDRLLAYVTGGATGTMSKAAAQGMAAGAVPALLLCSKLHPLETEAAAGVCEELTAAGSWQLPGSSGAAPAAAQRAAVAAHLLGQLTEAGALAPDRHADLVWSMALASMEALRHIFKQKAPAQEAAALEGQLRGYLDGLLGDAISSMPDQAKAAHAGSQGRPEAIAKFGTAVLRHRIDSPAALRTLRRFLAALLPAGESEEDEDMASDAPGDEGSAALAQLAGTLMQLLMSHSRFLPLLLSNPGGCLPPLPKAVAALQAPMASLLPVLDADLQQLQEPPSTKQEVLELLEALLDLHRRHSNAPISPDLSAQWRAALPPLLAGYGASLGACDRAALRVLLLLDAGLREPEQARGGQDGEEPEQAAEVAARLSGPLARAGFLWGRAAQLAQEQGVLLTDSTQKPLGAAGRAVLKDSAVIDARRCALAAVHFPERRTLGADEPDQAPSDAGPGGAPGRQLAYSAPGYDPAFLVPFCVQVLRDGAAGCEDLARWGVLPLVLRCLASADAPLRALAYEALALYSEALSAANFREKAQLAGLLQGVRLGVRVPFQRLPALAALFLAEGAAALCHPGTPLYAPVAKHLLRAASVDMQDAPLLRQLLLSGSPDQAPERLWLLRLLSAGMRGPEDGDIFRRRFVGELLMALHGSPLGDGPLGDAALCALCSCCVAPAYAADLVVHAGLVPWLACVALDAFARGAAAQHGAGHHHATALRATEALIELLHVRDWKPKGSAGSLGALHGFVQAARALCSASLGGTGLIQDSQQLQSGLRLAAAVQRLLNRGSCAAAAAKAAVLRKADVMALVTACSNTRDVDGVTAQLLLDLLLCLPPDLPVGAEDFVYLSTWMAGAALMHADHCSDNGTGSTTGSALAESSQDSTGSRVTLWLAACAAIGLPQGAAASQAPADAVAALVGGTGSRVAAAQKLLMLQAALPPEETQQAALVAVLLQLLQPAISSMLGLPPGDSTADLQPPADSAARWRFLLGNTLLRVLEQMPLLVDRAFQWWQKAAGLQWDTAGEEAGAVGLEAAAACELATVLLSELCMGQAPHLTCSMLRRWAGAPVGSAGQALAGVESMHAQAIGLEL